MMKKDKRISIEASGDVWEKMGPLEALSVAIYNEQAACDFYSGLEHVIENEAGKRKFASLVDDERQHRRLLEERYAGESGGKDFVFHSDKAKKVHVDVESQASAVDAVDLAIEAERTAHDFYRRAAQKTSDEEGKRMFERLAEDEERHHETLLAEREALLGGFYWFSADEQRIMEN